MKWTPEKDNPEIQRARIEELAKSVYPNAVVRFDQSWVGGKTIKLRIDEADSGRMVAGPSPEYESSEISDMSDMQVKQMLLSLPRKLTKTR